MGRVYLKFLSTRQKRLFALTALLLFSIVSLAPLQIGIDQSSRSAKVGIKMSLVFADTYYACTPATGGVNWNNSSSCPQGQNPVKNSAGQQITAQCSTGVNPNADNYTSGCQTSGNTTVQQPSNPNSVLKCLDLGTCIPDFVYIVTVGPTSIFAAIGSFLLSAAIKISLTSTAYALSFLTSGWTTVRDVANMAFLFILIFIAIKIIMEANTSSTASTLALVIVMAVLVNFSFFLTRVVIDAGNIAAVEAYNLIQAPNGTYLGGASWGSLVCGQSGSAPLCGMKDLTVPIMNAIGVQQLYSGDAFAKFQMPGQAVSWGQTLKLCVIYIASAVLLAILGFMFYAAAVKFVIRIVMLWVVLVASPLAFATKALPKEFNASKWFSRWTDTLLRNAFYPAIFLFIFIFVILFAQQALQLGCSGGGNNCGLGILGTVFQNANAGFSTDTNDSFGIFVVGIGEIALIMAILILLMYFAMRGADSAVTFGAGAANSFGSWVTRNTLGRYTGAVAWTGRNTAGRGFERVNQSRALRTAASWRGPVGMIARGLRYGAAKGGQASFDIRGVRVAGRTLQDAGLGQAGGRGGYRAAAQARAQRIEEAGKGLFDTPAQQDLRREKFENDFRKKEGILLDSSGNPLLDADGKPVSGRGETARQAERRYKGRQNAFKKQADDITADYIEKKENEFNTLEAERRNNPDVFNPEKTDKYNHEKKEKLDTLRGELAHWREQRRQAQQKAAAMGKIADTIAKARTKALEEPDQQKLKNRLNDLGSFINPRTLGYREGYGRLYKLLKLEPTEEKVEPPIDISGQPVGGGPATPRASWRQRFLNRRSLALGGSAAALTLLGAASGAFGATAEAPPSNLPPPTTGQPGHEYQMPSVRPEIKPGVKFIFDPTEFAAFTNQKNETWEQLARRQQFERKLENDKGEIRATFGPQPFTEYQRPTVTAEAGPVPVAAPQGTAPAYQQNIRLGPAEVAAPQEAQVAAQQEAGGGATIPVLSEAFEPSTIAAVTETIDRALAEHLESVGQQINNLTQQIATINSTRIAQPSTPTDIQANLMKDAQIKLITDQLKPLQSIASAETAALADLDVLKQSVKIDPTQLKRWSEAHGKVVERAFESNNGKLAESLKAGIGETQAQVGQARAPESAEVAPAAQAAIASVPQRPAGQQIRAGIGETQAQVGQARAPESAEVAPAAQAAIASVPQKPAPQQAAGYARASQILKVWNEHQVPQHFQESAEQRAETNLKVTAQRINIGTEGQQSSRSTPVLRETLSRRLETGTGGSVGATIQTQPFAQYQQPVITPRPPAPPRSAAQPIQPNRPTSRERIENLNAERQTEAEQRAVQREELDRRITENARQQDRRGGGAASLNNISRVLGKLNGVRRTEGNMGENPPANDNPPPQNS